MKAKILESCADNKDDNFLRLGNNNEDEIFDES